ncbi:MAG TPA: thioredoxin domain-containing protein, partial [Candidatus Acidoferrum sp.]
LSLDPGMTVPYRMRASGKAGSKRYRESLHNSHAPATSRGAAANEFDACTLPEFLFGRSWWEAPILSAHFAVESLGCITNHFIGALLEVGVNRRRILVAIVSVTLLVLGALFLPSLDQSPAPPPILAPTDGPRPLPRAATGASDQPLPLASEAAPLPLPQAPLQDVDPHKAFGSKNAPVVMEVFSDYQCPACKALYTNTNRSLMDNYVTTGKVYLIHRDFPLPMHAYSRVAARYARAAAEIGKIEPAEQALFQNQEKWEQNGDVDGTVASVLTPSEMNKVRALVKGGTLDALIDKDYALGQMYRVTQTPTTIFRCKGQTYPIANVMTYDTMKQFLDQLLSQSRM